MEPETLKRRIEAARILRGLSQADLGRRLEEDGLGKHDVGRIERGELTMRRVHLDALRRHLEMPEWWFTEEQLVIPERRPPATVLELVDALLTELDEDRAAALASWRRSSSSPPEEDATGSQTGEGG